MPVDPRLKAIRASVEKIGKIAATKSKFADIHRECTSFLELRAGGGAQAVTSPGAASPPGNASGDGADTATDVVVSRACRALTMTFRTHHPVMLPLALDCLHHLFAFGLLRGDYLTGLDGTVTPAPAPIDADYATEGEEEISRPPSFMVGPSGLAMFAGGGSLSLDGAPGSAKIGLYYRPGEPTIVRYVLDKLCALEPTTEHVQMQLIQTLLAAVTTDVCELHEGGLELAFRCLFRLRSHTKSLNVLRTAELALRQVVSTAFERLKAARPKVELSQSVLCDAMSLSDSAPPSPVMCPGIIVEEDDSLAERDCLLLFKLLCELCSGKLPEHAGADAPEVQQRILALTLLLDILRNSGRVLRSSRRCVQAIRDQLCMTLLQNYVSSVEKILECSLNIFLSLVVQFKEFLKKEIEVCFANIVFPLLNSQNATFHQRLVVIRTLRQVCESPQTIVDIYVNYDCDRDAGPIYENLVAALAKFIAATHVENHWVTRSQAKQLKNEALLALVAIATSMTGWMHKFVAALEPSLSGDPDGSDHGSQAAADEGEEVEDMERRRRVKGEAVELFNQKPKKAIEYLRSQEIASTPEALADWLMHTAGLDPTQIGAFLGDANDFNADVLRAYTAKMDFAGLTIDDALRVFFRGFKLPGEAQVMDRAMQTFARAFCAANPDHSPQFASQETAYVLAFSIIMLNTDAHNPQIEHKEKMTKEGFIQNNRGIDDHKDLPRDYICAIYDRIVTNEIRVETAMAKPTGNSALSASKSEKNFSLVSVLPSSATDRKRAALETEVANFLRTGVEGLRKPQRGTSTFQSATKIGHVKPMFEVSWKAMLPAFSVMFEETEEDEIIEACLRGFEAGIITAAMFGLSTEREAFVAGLSKLTLLHHNTREMRYKNVRCTQLLIALAKSHGDYLRTSWREVLKCLSQLAALLYLATGTARTEFAFIDQAPQKPSSAVEAANAKIVAQHVDPSEIDWIFSKSAQLSDEAIGFLVQYLCQVAGEEIFSTPPRISSTLSLVEVAAHNMRRVRYVWVTLWSFMSKHFIKVGCYHRELGGGKNSDQSSLPIILYAVDALKQLAMEFLLMGEEPGFQFQREFLKPFVVIMGDQNTPLEAKDLVIRCVTQMAEKKAPYLRSGWQSLFDILSAGAADQQEAVAKLAFDSMERIMQHHLAYALPSFPSLVNALLSFCCSGVEGICLRSIDHLRLAADSLADGVQVPDGVEFPFLDKASAAPTPIPGEPPIVSANFALQQKGRKRFLVPADGDSQIRVWAPILCGLRDIASGHSYPAVRTKAIAALFGVLSDHNSAFEGRWQVVLSGAVLPVLSHALTALAHTTGLATPGGKNGEGHAATPAEEKILQTLEAAASQLLNLLAHRFDSIGFALPDILTLSARCVALPGSRVAHVGVDTIRKLLLPTREGLPELPLTDDQWSFLCSSLNTVFASSLPQCLMEANLDPYTNCLKLTSAPPAIASPVFRQRGLSVTSAGAVAQMPSVPEFLMSRHRGVAALGERAGALASGANSNQPADHTVSILAIQVQIQTHAALLDVLDAFITANAVKRSTAQVDHLLKCAYSTYQFVCKWLANATRFHAFATAAHPIAEASGLRSLFGVQRRGLEIYVNSLLALYQSEDEAYSTFAHSRLQAIALELLRRIHHLLSQLHGADAGNPAQRDPAQEELLALTPVAVQLLEAVTQFPDASFNAYLPVLFSPVADLVLYNRDPGLAVAVREFLRHVGRRALTLPDSE
eukprot:TRINITY_DN7350_c0_g2_i1.p1 TRINITY_DN7350_c0_g2~~TRINITY_DN7350_c0_g2_i1.p1  ORF type:complete len:1737 (+),score=332.28 TRINITY_DN7350_c0_g2_i1:124-5334(+)